MGIETDLAAANFDAIRAQMGVDDDLVLEKSTTSGYTQLGSTVTSGWHPHYLPATNNESVTIQVLLAESSQWDTANMRYLATVTFDGRRYKVKSDPPPMGEPRIWRLKGQPTGETV